MDLEKLEYTMMTHNYQEKNPEQFSSKIISWELEELEQKSLFLRYNRLTSTVQVSQSNKINLRVEESSGEGDFHSPFLHRSQERERGVRMGHPRKCQATQCHWGLVNATTVYGCHLTACVAS